MPSVSRTIELWEAIDAVPPPVNLRVLSVPTPKVDYDRKSDGGWLYLEGIELTLDGTEYDAHLTITKPLTKNPKSDEWHLCHFTVTRAVANHLFFEVADDGTYRTTSTLLSREGKQTNGKDHYPGKSVINDAKLLNAVEDDLRLLFRYLAS
ncbi:hypothetical protein [Actinokineospora bangkokensis]|uniref:Uncharacterized protein n=1 Tax=Actinokineospora bangkokensis TaxID=1193682 RepID=A0A1Q9LJQ8_9PSEU|nr:hypothetical protein [Actinokineospora bangkokensis]OLR92250.1 hypothetical protein BJP25_23320 [Actinokineospora bangkokensis]